MAKRYYKGQFRDINNNLYNVEINSPYFGTPVELTFTDTPVVINMQNNDDIYKTIKYTTCTISLVNQDLYIDLFSGEYTNYVAITDADGDVVWVGIITPNIYSQNYALEYEVLELECIDFLGVLQEKDYTTINDTKTIHTFAEIFTHILSKVDGGCEIVNFQTYDYEPVNGFEQFDQGSNKWDMLYINEQNFFDEDNNPMKCSEVLDEILKYYGWCMVQWKDEYYIYNVDNAPHQDYTFKSLDLTIPDDGYSFISIDKDIIDINNHIVSNNGNVSIDKVYNKISITNDLYPIGNVLPDIFKDLELYTNSTARTTSNGLILPYEFVGRTTMNNISYTGPASFEYSEGFIAANPKYRNTPVSDDYVWYFNQIYKSKSVPYIEHTKLGENMYSYNGSFITSFYPGKNLSYTTNYPDECINAKDYYGVFIQSTSTKSTFKEQEETEKTEMAEDELNTIQYKFIPELGNTSIAVRRIPVLNDTTAAPETAFLDKYFFCKLKANSNLIFNNSMSFCLDFKMYLYGAFKSRINTNKSQLTKEEYFDDMESLSVVESAGFSFVDGLRFPPEMFKLYVTDPSIEAYIYFNGKYYAGDGVWTTTPTLYKIPLEINGDAFIPVRNYTFLNNVQKECHVITTNDTNVYVGDFYIAFKYPTWMSTIQPLVVEVPRTYGSIEYLVMNDISITIENANATEENNTDNTIYEGVINTNNIEEHPGITLKVSTWDNKEPNYSCVILGDGKDFRFLDNVYYENGVECRMEEILLDKYISQYSSPAIIYNVSINKVFAPWNAVYSRHFEYNYNIENFVLTGFDWDIKHMQNNITVRELKKLSGVVKKKQNIQRQYYRTGLIYKANPS